MQRLNFLFWNIYNKDLSEEIYNIVNAYDIDIIILAEVNINPNLILLKLNHTNSYYYSQNPISTCEKITIITKFDFKYISPVKDDDRFTIRKINLPLLSKEILLMSVHLPAMNISEESKSENCNLIKCILETTEILEGNTNSIIVGDFNMNPFDKGIIKANGIHALISSSQAKKVSKVIQGRKYNFFYNPMWSLLGDLNKLASGSYYYPGTELVSYHWHIFDQVLIRPALIDNFVKDSLHILESDGKKSLLNLDNTPNKKNYSDHLPIIFSLIL